MIGQEEKVGEGFVKVGKTKWASCTPLRVSNSLV